MEPLQGRKALEKQMADRNCNVQSLCQLLWQERNYRNFQSRRLFRSVSSVSWESLFTWICDFLMLRCVCLERQTDRQTLWRLNSSYIPSSFYSCFWGRQSLTVTLAWNSWSSCSASPGWGLMCGTTMSTAFHILTWLNISSPSLLLQQLLLPSAWVSS